MLFYVNNRFIFGIYIECLKKKNTHDKIALIRYKLENGVDFMQIALSSGNYDIIDSGQVFLFGEQEDLRIDVAINEEFSFSMIFKFTKDNSKEQQVKKIIEENTIIFSCFNFDDVGTGLSEPMSIAKIDNKEMFLLFWSYLEGTGQTGKVRSVKYTIFCEK